MALSFKKWFDEGERPININIPRQRPPVINMPKQDHLGMILPSGEGEGKKTAYAMGRQRSFETAVGYDVSKEQQGVPEEDKNHRRLSNMQKAIRGIMRNSGIENEQIRIHFKKELNAKVFKFDHLFAGVEIEDDAIVLQYAETAGKGPIAKALWTMARFTDPFNWRGLRSMAMKMGLWQDIEENLVLEIKTQLAGAENRGMIQPGTYHENEWLVSTSTIGRDVIIQPKVRGVESDVAVADLPMAAHNLNL